MVKKEKSRIDIIGQNGNTGEHYEEVMPNGRWNWYGEGEPVWKEEPKVGPCSAHAHQQDRWAVEDQNIEALKKMQRHSAYNAKFWIFEEKRYGTWEESQEFYRKLDEEKRVQTTEAYIRQHLSSSPSSGTPAWGDLRRRLVED